MSLLRHVVRGFAVAAVVALGGCAGALDPGAGAGACVEPGQPVQATLISVIRSGSEQQDPLSAVAPSAPRLVSLIRPEQVAVSGPDVYIADSGLGAVLRTDRGGMAFNTVARLPATRLGGLAVDRFGTVMLALPGDSTLLQFGRLGSPPPPIGAGTLSSPVDVATDGTGSIVVGDGLGARVVRFNRIGQVQAAIGERGDRPNPFSAVTAVALAADSLYVLDGLARQVTVFPASGASRAVSLGPEARMPVALAADRWGRIYVADAGRRGLTVLQAATPQLGDLGGVPSLQSVSDVFIDESDSVYVADSAAGAVYVLAVPQPCP